MNRAARTRTTVSAMLALACAAAQASDIRTSTSFTPLDEAPAAMVTADDQTLVLIYELPLRVTTRRPNAAGELVEHASLTLQGNRFNRLAKGDLTGNGHPDIVLFALQERLLHILINQGDGTFVTAPKSPYPTPTPLSASPAITIADLDNTGTPDILLSATGGIYRYPSLGHGELGFPAIIAPGIVGNELLVGDFKGIGQNQIAVISNTNIRLLEKNGDAYEPTLDRSTSSAIFRMITGETLPDNRQTILAAISGTQLQTLTYNPNNNTFTTVTSPGAATGINPSDASFSDINADGIPDLIMAYPGASTLRATISDPDAPDGYAPLHPAGLFYGLNHVAVIDINANGLGDAVHAVSNPPGLFALINDPDHAFRAHGSVGTKPGALYSFLRVNAPGQPTSFFLPRFNSGPQIQANQIATILPDSPGHAIQTTDLQGPPAAPTHTRWTVADLDNDGRPDLIKFRRVASTRTSAQPHALFYHRALPDDTFAEPIEIPFTAVYNLSTPVVADFNNDGIDDVAIMDAYGLVFIFLGSADGTIAPPIEFQLVPQPASFLDGAYGALMAADLDNDGVIDLVGANRLAQGSAVYIAYGLGDAQFETPVSMPAPPNAGGQISPAQAVGDLNDDGILDIAIASSTQSAVSLSTGPRSYAPFQTVSSAPNTGVLFITDFTADGRNELVLTYRGFTEVIRFADGQPEPDPARFLTPAAVQAIHFEDLTDNGLPDMLIASGQGLSIIYNRTADPCPADINNDGQLNFFDVAAYLILFNAGDPAADLNNDGKLNFFDLAAYIALFNAGCP